ncbi:hypothetical protein [Helicobacter canis]|uniref:hypothetical protein n=1 Tax=Helicobacter canis TaxID=29419 RepID=UPI0029439229|nr:hypothetical protein [Helicobacter canis]
MRIDYGLSATSLSSLLHTTRDLDSSSSEKDATQDIQAKAPVKATQNPKDSNKALESTQQSTPRARETFGLEILEKMSDKEYQVFLRASEGMSEVEKMAAAQALYVFTESYAQDSSAQNLKPHLNPRKNPYFNARDQFITRYIALYNGAQEVDILS